MDRGGTVCNDYFDHRDGAGGSSLIDRREWKTMSMMAMTSFGKRGK